MSEPGGVFPSENFVSNEKTYQFVIPTLQRTLTRNGVYLGVGPEQNFTYVVNLKPRLAVIFDIRRQNAMLHLLYKALFELSPTRASFVARLFSRELRRPVETTATATELFDAIAGAAPDDSAFRANWDAIVKHLTVTHGFPMSPDDVASMRRVFEAFRQAGPSISYAFRVGAPPPTVTEWFVTYAQLQSAGNADGVNMSFLATEDSYRWLRTFQRRNLVVPVVADFGGPLAIRAVGDYLKQHDATVTAFYTSNVEQYLFMGSDSDRNFYGSVETLPLDSTATFIRAVPPAGNPIARIAAILPRDPRASGVRIIDSAGTTIVYTTLSDSGGKETTTRQVVQRPPATVANTSAFTSGIAPIRRTLDAFRAGELRSYQQVQSQTQIDGWRR
jgi:hypothetical protein